MRDNFTCQYCGRHAPEVILQVDHKVAKANGGTDDSYNLVTACSACNVGKHLTPLCIHVENSQSKSRASVIARIENYLATLPGGEATATEVAKVLGVKRATISQVFRRSGRFIKGNRKGPSVYYRTHLNMFRDIA